jgi:hypothetical protein
MEEDGGRRDVEDANAKIEIIPEIRIKLVSIL